MSDRDASPEAGPSKSPAKPKVPLFSPEEEDEPDMDADVDMDAPDTSRTSTQDDSGAASASAAPLSRPSRPRAPSPPLPEHLVDPDSDDEIAHTLPIYISHALHPSINLFQYPLAHRPPGVSSYARAHGEKITARMKEAVGRFEVEIPVDQREEVWNEERAKELGFEEPEEDDGRKKKGKAKEEDRYWGTKMRLRGEEVPSVTGYWSGIVHDGALHLQPISHLLQFRPSLGYLDALDQSAAKERERDRRRANGGDSEDDSDAGGGGPSGGGATGAGDKDKPKKKEDLKTVSVTLAPTPEESGFVRPASKMGTGGTVGSTTQIRAKLVQRIQKEQEDTWREWSWNGADSQEVVQTLGQFLTPEENQVVLECKTQALDVLSKKNIGEGAKL